MYTNDFPTFQQVWLHDTINSGIMLCCVALEELTLH
jgi:hypothetical protein